MNNIKSIIKKNHAIILFFLLIIICIIFLINANTVFCRIVKTSGHSFFSFFQLGLSEIKSVFSTSIKTFEDSKKLQVENKKLQERFTDYVKVINENAELRIEIDKLKALLDFSTLISSVYDQDVQAIPASIIAKPPGNFFSSITVNKGKVDGINENMAVIAVNDNYQGLVGKIVTAGYNSSIVMPIYSDAFFISARFQNSYYEGIINGLGESSRDLLMRYVSKQAKSDIKFNDLVISSGMGGVFPKGISIGTVKAIRSKTYDTSIEVEIEPVIDFSKLEYVIILKNREKNE